MEYAIIYLKTDADNVLLFVHIQPGAKNTAWAGEYGERIKLRLAAPPIDGRANAALCQWLANEFDFSLRDVSVLRGHNSRAKTICFHAGNSRVAEIQQRLMQAPG